MIDDDTFDAYLTAEMQEYTGTARLNVDADRLAHAVATKYPRRRLALPWFRVPQAFVWIGLAGSLIGLVLIGGALGSRQGLLPVPSPVASPTTAPQTVSDLFAFDRLGDVYLKDTSNGRTFKVDGPPEDLYLDGWSPDGRWLSMATEDRVYLLDLTTLELQPAPTPSSDFMETAATPVPATFVPGAPTAAPQPPRPGSVDPLAPYGYNSYGWMPNDTTDSVILHIRGGRHVAVNVADGTATDLRDDDLCHLAVSPNRQQFAAIDQSSVGDNSSAHRGTIVIIDAATGTRTEVAEFGGLNCGYYFGSDTPAWSPDSMRLAIVGIDSLQVINSDGTGLTDIGILGFPEGDLEHRTDVRAAWSPDGQWIAFASPAGLEIVRPDGSERHVLVADRRLLHAFAWTQDSRTIDYAMSIDSPTFEGYIASSVDIQTGENRTIDLDRPWVLSFTRQPLTAGTPSTNLP